MILSRITIPSYVTPRRVQAALLILLAVLGAYLLFRATPEGLNLSDDSIAYIAGARSLLAGQGYREAWLESNQPVTHFPPGFSAALALIGLTGIDPLLGARLLNALLFGVNASLLGLLGWRMTKSGAAGLFLAALFLTNDSLFRVHAAAMSEPLFLFFSLMAFLHIDFYFSPSADGRAQSEGWLVAAGVISALAYLTRYSGLALVATFVLALLILQDTWKKRFVSAGVYLLSFVPLVAAWSIRNRLVAGSSTNRTLIWHPVTPETLAQGVRTFTEFLVPLQEGQRVLFKLPALVTAVIALLALGILVWVARAGWRRFRDPSTPLPEVLGFTNGLYIFGYLGAVLFSINFFDASTPLKVRILAPIYPPLLLLLVGAGAWVWTHRPRAGQAAVAVVALLLLGVSAFGQVRTVQEYLRGPLGFASFHWSESKVLEFVRTVSPEIHIYTNEPGAVYLYTGRGCRVIPTAIDPVTRLPYADYEGGVAAMQKDVLSGYSMLVLFGVNDPDRQAESAILTKGLYQIMKFSGDAIYYTPPPMQ